MAKHGNFILFIVFAVFILLHFENFEKHMATDGVIILNGLFVHLFKGLLSNDISVFLNSDPECTRLGILLFYFLTFNQLLFPDFITFYFELIHNFIIIFVFM